MAARNVCLIVDNPLRDLDGLVLLAATLAVKGVECYLVPMYEQGFDLMGIRPDLVVSNYIRDNNRDLLVAYKQLGIRVLILDTEGAAGRVPEDFAEMVARMSPGDLVDAYCVWGDERYAALKRRAVIPDARLHLTGCPRFDYCAPRWRDALGTLDIDDGFLLFNTNFPLVNPRFVDNSGAERETLIRVWKDVDYVDAVLRDARMAFDGMLAAANATATRFPSRQIIIRPHPFESVLAYQRAIHRPNVSVRQEGTSLQWIARSSALIHQNCSTAVEATMLDREPLSLEWLSTDALRIKGPGEVSRPIASQQQLEDTLARIVDGTGIPAAPEIDRARAAVVGALFHANDGRSCERVAAVILDCLDAPSSRPAGAGESARGRAIRVARSLLGHPTSARLRDLNAKRAERVRAKHFSAEKVSSLLQRLAACAAWTRPPTATPASPAICAVPRMCSGHAVRVSCQ